MRRSLRIRIFFTIFLSVSIIYIVATSLILLEVKKIFTSNLKQETHKLIESSSDYFNRIFSEDVEVLRSLKNTLLALYEDENFEELTNDQQLIIERIIEETPQFLAIGINWEINAIDSTYKKNHGRYRYLYYRKEGKITERIDTIDLNSDAIGSLYYKFKVSKLDDITDIYYDSYSGRKEDEELMSSIGIPIVVNDVFVGLVACDISLERFGRIIIKDIKPINEAQAFLVSHNGRIIANSSGDFINSPLQSILGNDVAKYNLLLKIQEGQSSSFIQKDKFGNKNLIILEPFTFGSIDRSWSIGIIVPLDIIQKDANRLFRIRVLLAIIGLILMTISISITINSIIKPINTAVDNLEKLSKMDISKSTKITKSKNKDELAKMTNSINELIDSLTKIKDFAYDISQGNLNTKLELKSEKDILGKALHEMQRSLKIAKIEEEKREEEEKMQKWTIAGEAEISSILRQYAQDIDQLSYETVSYLVKYTGAAQGAFFIINEEDHQIELLSAYAYNRRKFIQKNIPFGIGLVGRSVQEGETIYITDIPEGYTSITSGLGENEPRTLLIIPFKFNEVIYAVLELTSFKDFKPNVRKFIERIGVNVASTVANLQITLRTNKLVSELQKRGDELTSHEEAMRRNLIEVQSSQEEVMKKANEYETVVNALNQVSYLIEYDMDRRIIDINAKFLRLLGKTKAEMLGTKQGAYMMDEDREKQLDKLWNNLRLGNVTMFTQQVAFESKIIWFSEAYIPIFDVNGKPYKVINIANDVTNLMD